MDRDTAVRYLDRISAPEPRQPDLATLRELQRRHLETVPFENLSIHLGEPILLTEDALVEKVVGRRRGGFCYELNGLFSMLLTALGFDVRLHAASVFGADGTLSPAFDHLVLSVELDERWLVDVGFGVFADQPLRRDWPEAQEDPAGSFLVLDAPGGDLDLVMNGERQYRAEAYERRLTDFVRPCWWHATSPDSHFRTVARCSRRTEDGRVSIVGDRLYETAGGERTETVLATDAEMLTAYEKHFGMRLPRSPTC
ncbi:arylamine N-acetyltransferase family protein [Actinophytocola oryzae]|uniref:N-hydroxyarylamine O-acetyltransferase n=1 Tax=Actinophytocola oryzae TaxID=502181 RepID=A0A4R7VP48_9PSEU|nr:arylamine N-acetyltransferase [Actinophytocola oryzae]TDV50967.1 N-hydroxyarylamine O-acetyltransferase [Actinophytocola oryzae]